MNSRVKWFIVPVAIASMVAVAPATAQPDTGHIIQRYDRAELPEGVADAREAQQALYDYGACLTKVRRRQVERFLATDPFSDEAGRVGQQIMSGECLSSGEMRFAAYALRGPFYQALFRRDFGNKAMPDLKSAPKLELAAGTVSAGGATGPLASLRLFADCVVRQDQFAARQLSMSEVGSADEKAALRALGPSMSRCIAPGDKLQFRPPLLRSVFGEVLYRLAAASSGRPMVMDK
jgi:hypothetical protein